MHRLLLTVDGAFRSPSGDVLWLTPWLVDLFSPRPLSKPRDDWWPEFPRMPSPRPAQVELRTPDGMTRTVVCRFENTFVAWRRTRTDTPPGYQPGWVVVCALLSIDKADVPPGTEVWYDADT